MLILLFLRDLLGSSDLGFSCSSGKKCTFSAGYLVSAEVSMGIVVLDC